MKLIGMTVIVALACASCSKPIATETEEVQQPVPPATPSAEPPPAPEPASASAPPAPAPPQLAPEGVFYLIAAARVETDSGVHGLPPGTGVKRVRPGIYLTPYGEVPLADAQLTNDMNVARAARDAAMSEQAALRNRSAADAAAALERSRTNAIETGASHEAALKSIDAERLTRQISVLQQQKIAAEQQLNTLTAKRGKENYNKVWKGRTVTSTTEQQMNAVSAQIQAFTCRLMPRNRPCATRDSGWPSRRDEWSEDYLPDGALQELPPQQSFFLEDAQAGRLKAMATAAKSRATDFMW
jgi:hypothetical protein